MLQAYANESKITGDLKAAESGAAVIEDGVFMLMQYLYGDGKALEEHFWLSCWDKSLD